MNEQPFRTDNIEGYSQADLDALNAEFARRVTSHDSDDYHSAGYSESCEECVRISADILKHPPEGIEPGA